MSTAAGYRLADKVYVRENLFKPDWVPSPKPSAGWVGIVHEGEYLVPDPVPSGAMAAPTIYAGWKLQGRRAEGNFAGTSAPVRWGDLIVSCYLEKGALTGFLDALQGTILDLLDAASDGPISFEIQESEVITVGYVGPWFVQDLKVPYCG